MVEEIGLEDLRATGVDAEKMRRRKPESNNDSTRHSSITYPCIINIIVFLSGPVGLT